MHIIPGFSLQAKTTDEWENDRKHYTIYPAKLKKQVKQWYSPSGSFITINSDLHRSLKCGESVSLNVIYSLFPETEVDKSYYQVNALTCIKISLLLHTQVPHQGTSPSALFCLYMRVFIYKQHIYREH